MKTIFLLALFLVATGPASAAPKTYAQAQNDLAWVGNSVEHYRGLVKQGIKDHSANLETMNRIRQARIKAEEMFKLDNTAKACKVIDYAFTAATLGTGAIAAAGKEGLSVLSREGAKVAGKYLAEKGSVEVGKEVAGVPGYSDSVKAGAYVLRKFDERELSTQLTRDNIEILNRAAAIIQDDSDGRTLQAKLRDLHALELEMEQQLEKSANEIIAADNNLEKKRKEAAEIIAQGRKLKEAERLKAEKEYEAAKIAKPANIMKTGQPKPAEVPPPAAAPDASAEERRRKMQEAINNYIAALGQKIAASRKSAAAAWAGVSEPEKKSALYDAREEIARLGETLLRMEAGLSGLPTYLAYQGLEDSAKIEADYIQNLRTGLEAQKSDIKSKIEPILEEINGYLGQWKTVQSVYTPQGYYVPEPDDLTKTTEWNHYYMAPLAWAEVYLKGTEGMPGRFRALSAAAGGMKDGVYTAVKEAADSYAAKAQSYKDFKPQATSRLKNISQELVKHYEVLNQLPHQFTLEFSYDGKKDLANLESKIAAAKPAFAAVQRLGGAGAALYAELGARAGELYALAAAPLLNEAHSIAHSAKNKSHKDAIAASMEKTQGFTADMNGLEFWNAEGSAAAADLMFGAEDGLKYLKKAEDRLLTVYAKAISAFKANTSGDLSRLEGLPEEQYAKEIARIFAPLEKADSEQREISAEVKEAPLFGAQGANAPLAQTGFWTVRAEAKRTELEKIRADFWESPSGKALTEARRKAEFEKIVLAADPDQPLVRKLYEDFAAAYGARNAAKVMSYVSGNWSAGDGTGPAELEETLRNNFRLYDEVRFSVTGLNISKTSKGHNACYTVSITSRIFKRNLKHEETSQVCEEVEREDGKLKIVKTGSGSYWNIK